MSAADRSSRPPSVAKLGTAILKAIDRGDMPRAQSLLDQMMAIVLGTADGYSGEASVRAFQWLAAVATESC